MTTATMTHPLALTPAQEGAIAFALGDTLEDNPFNPRENYIAWQEWHDAWMACDRANAEWQEEYDREVEELIAEAQRWD